MKKVQKVEVDIQQFISAITYEIFKNFDFKMNLKGLDNKRTAKINNFPQEIFYELFGTKERKVTYKNPKELEDIFKKNWYIRKCICNEPNHGDQLEITKISFELKDLVYHGSKKHQQSLPKIEHKILECQFTYKKDNKHDLKYPNEIKVSKEFLNNKKRKKRN